MIRSDNKTNHIQEIGLLLIILITIFSSCKSDQKENKKLVDHSLQEWIVSYDFQEGNQSMVSFFNQLKKQQGFNKRENLFSRNSMKRKGIFKTASYLLYTGKTKEAIDEINNIKQNKLNKKQLIKLKQLLGIAYMRLGEQENCIANHNHQSCIIPLQKNAIHTIENGSRNAIKIYKELLEINPEDYGSEWLLNLAYMTLGEYPDHVPKKHLIPFPSYNKNNENKLFEDIAPGLGLDEISLSGGSIMEDFNNDGFLDVMNSSWQVEGHFNYHVNNGDGTFSNKTKDANLEGTFGGLNMLQADFNNDGLTDVLILRGAWHRSDGSIPNSLLKNNGDNTFEDVTVKAGLLDFYPTQNAVFSDFNNDGFLDLVFAVESIKNSFENAKQLQFYSNNKNGTFTNITESIPLEIKKMIYIKGLTVGDYNNDDKPDIYISAMHGENILLKNTTEKSSTNFTFEDVSSVSKTQEPKRSFPTWFWDYDNDGWLDIFVADYGSIDRSNSVSEIAQALKGKKTNIHPRLYKNNKDGTFSEISEQAQLDQPTYSMGANFGDIDNDGLLDLYLGTGTPNFKSIYPNRMYQNKGEDKFEDITMQSGTGHIQKGHGIAFGDIDNDGDQDILAEMGGAANGDVFQNSLFQNKGNNNHWITLLLEGVESNRSAIGTRIKIIIIENNTEREIHRVVSSGGSFGASSLQQEIGLGQAEKIKQVEVHWPKTGKTQTFKNIPRDKKVKIIENNSKYTILESKTIQFKKMESSRHDHH